MEALRGENLDELLRLVGEVEAKSFATGLAPPAKANRYHPVYLKGPWLCIGPDPARLRQTVASISLHVLRGRFRQATSEIRSIINKPVAMARVSASRIRVKNNVLVIYSENGLVAKFRKPASIREPDSLHNEYMTLCEIAAFDRLNAPEPIAFESEPIPTIWMKYVSHTRVSGEDTDSIARRIAEALLAWYEHSGVNQVPTSSYLPLLGHLSAGIEALVAKGWDEAEAEKIYSLIGIIADSQTPLFLSRIHGDASAGNAMVTPEGKLVINDWENSRVDIVGFDLVKLSQNDPQILNLYSRWRSNLAGTSAAGASIEFALVRVLAGINLNYHLRYWGEVRKWSPPRVRSLLAAKKRSIIELCDSFRLGN